MPEATEAMWEPWDPEQGARAFRGKEITAVPAVFHEMTTMHRQDYPKHPVWVRPKERVNHLDRPVPKFPASTSYREFYTEHKIVPTVSAAANYPKATFDPKFSTVTTNRADFVQPALPPRPKTLADKDRKFTPNTAPIGSTTTRDDYLPWNLPKPRQRAGELPPSRPTKFDGTTTTRADFLFPAKLPPAPVAHQNPLHVSRGKFDGTTTHREDYGIIPLPKGMVGGIGLQVATAPYKQGGVGGHFEPMIREGAPAPQMAQKTFTTVQDEQTTANIVVVTKRRDRPDGVVLGFFPLSGLKKGPAGVPKIDVTLKLQNEKTLHASATYVQGGKKCALTFVSGGRRAPPLRAVTDVSEAPR